MKIKQFDFTIFWATFLRFEDQWLLQIGFCIEWNFRLDMKKELSFQKFFSEINREGGICIFKEKGVENV